MPTPPLNQILYGPPGTGKTYETINAALEILQSGDIRESRAEQKKAFDGWKAKGHIGFVTFHQSFSYEDFVEGICAETAPAEKSTTVLTYRVKSGIFKRFCQQRMEHLPEHPSYNSKAQENKQHFPIEIKPSANVWKVSLAKTYENPVRSECLANGHIRIGWDLYGENITPQTKGSILKVC